MTTSHANCDHPATKAARAACRKARAEVDTLALDLVQVLNSGYCPTPDYWLTYGARRFGQLHGGTPSEKARAILDYFAPSADPAYDERRRANGYTITTDLHAIRAIILRAAS